MVIGCHPCWVHRHATMTSLPLHSPITSTSPQASYHHPQYPMLYSAVCDGVEDTIPFPDLMMSYKQWLESATRLWGRILAQNQGWPTGLSWLTVYQDSCFDSVGRWDGFWLKMTHCCPASKVSTSGRRMFPTSAILSHLRFLSILCPTTFSSLQSFNNIVMKTLPPWTWSHG